MTTKLLLIIAVLFAAVFITLKTLTKGEPIHTYWALASATLWTLLWVLEHS